MLKLLLFVICLKIVSNLKIPDSDCSVKGSAALDNFPIIDGHNDLPFNLYYKVGNKLANFSFDTDLSKDGPFSETRCNTCKTDLPRLRKGKLAGQFWVAYTRCQSNTTDFVIKTLRQIDVIKRVIKKYPNDLKFVTTADGILEAFKEKKIASLIGVEGGHSIENSLAVLRMFYELGVRYLTLTHQCSTSWADNSSIDQSINSTQIALKDLGKQIVLEMNRLGMLVDLAHVSRKVMSEVLDITRAPVIFSHSSARTVYDHHRNVPDEILKRVTENDGIVMVNFYDKFIARENATIVEVAAHINHIANVAGFDHVGIGSDFDGVPSVSKGLEDVSKYPDLFDLLRTQNCTKWSIENLEKLAGRNLVRVLKKVEEVRDALIDELPREETLEIY